MTPCTAQAIKGRSCDAVVGQTLAWIVGRHEYDDQQTTFDEVDLLHRIRTGQPSYGQLMAEGKPSGQPRSGLDTIIAAITQANECVVVTDNEKDVRGIEILNPMRVSGG